MTAAAIIWIVCAAIVVGAHTAREGGSPFSQAAAVVAMLASIVLAVGTLS